MNVAELLRFRRNADSKPKARQDVYRLGLVIEGGGMRGIVSAGMLTAITDLGFSNCFDSVYGSSAGSINASYFLSDQPHYGTSIYYNEANTDAFIAWRKLLWGKSPMQLDFLLNEVFMKKKYLDWESVINSPIELNVLASSLDRSEIVSLKNFKTRSSLMQALKAGSCIPWFAGDPVLIDGERMVDASFYDSIPYKFAVRDNCTHVLVLRTRPQGVVRKQPSVIEHLALKYYFTKHGHHHYDFYFQKRSDLYNQTTQALDSGKFNEECAHASIMSIALASDSRTISQLEKRRQVLVNGAISGYARTMSIFGHNDISALEVIGGYNKQGESIQNIRKGMGQ